MPPRVQLFVNCFERDYRQVLAPGFLAAKAAQFQFPFFKRVVTLNNIRAMHEALALARSAVQRGEVEAFIEVESALPSALSRCGLRMCDLGVVRHYVDFALVAVAQAAPDYLLYCCAEVDLLKPSDWITPALEMLRANPGCLVANPSWASDPVGAEREAVRKEGAYFLGHGFSDQCFLADASRLARPVYRFKHPAGDRYPMSDLGDIFEKRMDAYMRHENLLRITDSRVFYRHLGREGTGYPRAPLMQRVGRRILRVWRGASAIWSRAA